MGSLKNARGVSTMQALLAAGITAIGALGVVSILTQHQRIEKKMASRSQYNQTQSSIISVLENKTLMKATLSKNSPIMDCLRFDTVACSTSPQKFDLYGSDDKKVDGFDAKGKICARGTGAPSCDHFIDFHWEPLCVNPMTCFNPDYAVVATFKKPDNTVIDGMGFRFVMKAADPPMPVVPVTPGAGFHSVSTGEMFTCAIIEKFEDTEGVLHLNQAKCWGYNEYGKLGTGWFSNGQGYGDHATELISNKNLIVNLGKNPSTGLRWQVKSVSAGRNHACAILENDKIKCWGGNAYGQLGIGTLEAHGAPTNGPMGDALPFVSFPTYMGVNFNNKKVLKLSLASYSTCAILESHYGSAGGSVWCWGNGTGGQLGIGTEVDAVAPMVPIDFAGISGFDAADEVAKDISSVFGGRHCIVTGENRAFCWGTGHNGGRYIGMYKCQGSFTHSWGNGLGSEPNQIRTWYTNTVKYSDGCKVRLPTQLRNKVLKVALGYFHTCFLVDDSQEALDSGTVQKTSGNVYCVGNSSSYGGAFRGDVTIWGDSDTELDDNWDPIGLGDGPGADSCTTLSAVFTPGAPGGRIVDIKSYNQATCAVNLDGHVRCWGDGDNGALGYGHVGEIGDDDFEIMAGADMYAPPMQSQSPMTGLRGSISGTNWVAKAKYINVGWQHSCGIFEMPKTTTSLTPLVDRLVCWGRNGMGELARPQLTSDIYIGDQPFDVFKIVDFGFAE